MQPFMPESVLTPLDGRSLFYPCSGADWQMPIQLFAPWISDFWFVDKAYFTSKSALEEPPLLARDPLYRLLDVQVEGPALWDRRAPHITPCVRSETYRHEPSGRVVRIHRRRGYGFSALRKAVFGELGVFFYRGDSMGEGGSGNLWLLREHVREVLRCLPAGGLLVTDGSQHGRAERGEYDSFWRYRDLKVEDVQALLQSAEPFADGAGRQFRCVGYAGRRYGHTLAWQRLS